jgi:hypothetical protein
MDCWPPSRVYEVGEIRSTCAWSRRKRASETAPYGSTDYQVHVVIRRT